MMQNGHSTDLHARTGTPVEVPLQLLEHAHNQSTCTPSNDLNRDEQDWYAWLTSATVFDPDATMDQEMSMHFVGNGLQQTPQP
jgi:hypothetical protein